MSDFIYKSNGYGKQNYGGLDNEFTSYKDAKIVVLPVPYDGTSTWLKGADKGPDAILEASANMELYDIETDSEVYTQGIATLDPVTESSSPEAMSDAVEMQVDTLLKDKKFPVLLGGEHSVSIGSIRAFAKHYEDFRCYNWMHIRICVTHTKGPITIMPVLWHALKKWRLWLRWESAVPVLKKNTTSIRTGFFMHMKLKSLRTGCTMYLKS